MIPPPSSRARVMVLLQVSPVLGAEEDDLVLGAMIVASAAASSSYYPSVSTDSSSCPTSPELPEDTAGRGHHGLGFVLDAELGVLLGFAQLPEKLVTIL